VGAGFDLVDPRLTNEIGHVARFEPPADLGVVDAAVTANHVPRRIANHGVEAGRAIGCGRKDIREGQRPVQKAMRAGDGLGSFEKFGRHAIGQRRRTVQQPAHEIDKDRAAGCGAIAPEPGGAPEVERRLPLRQR